MYKCRFCSFETDDYKVLAQHEMDCYKVYDEEQRRKREKELVEDINKLNTCKLEYERLADKLKERYTDEELEKFSELFPVDKTTIRKDYSCNNENIQNNQRVNEDAIRDVIRHVIYGR